MASLSVRFGAFIVLLAGATAVASPDRLADGKRNYERVCAGCHETGAAGAPIVGNTGDWGQRSRLWEAVLLEHAEHGYLKMPARGGADFLTEYDVGTAAEYMFTLTHPSLPAD